jgi:hypothetical protein
MSVIQKLTVALLPRRQAVAMEAESRSWMVRYACGFARSIWDLGGIRWEDSGQPRYLSCPQCGQASWHTVSRDQPGSSQLQGT